MNSTIITCPDCGYQSQQESFQKSNFQLFYCPECGYKWIPKSSIFDEVPPVQRSMSYASSKMPLPQPEYQLEKSGLLYDINGNDVFTIKELLYFNVPVFKSIQQANEFLNQLEHDGKRNPKGRKFGRVPEEDLLEKIKKERDDLTDKVRKNNEFSRKENRTKEHLERNKQIMKGEFYDLPKRPQQEIP